MTEENTNPANQGTSDDAAAGNDPVAMGDDPVPNGDFDPQLMLKQKELMETQAKLQEMTNISQRALADLQNYKRRVEEEKAGFITFANASLFTELLPAIQNIHRALAAEPKDAEWIKGAIQTMTQITQTAEKMGLKPIPTVGETFNPLLHEALLTAPGEKDKILEELEKGYMLGDRVLKPARVKVGTGE